jgi:hypothetical protein
LENPELNKFPPSFVGEILESDSVLVEKLSQVGEVFFTILPQFCSFFNTIAHPPMRLGPSYSKALWLLSRIFQPNHSLLAKTKSTF